MPFKETCRMEERVQILAEYEIGHWSVSELCRRHGVSRDTFYAWRARRASGDANWFSDRSHATQSCPHRTQAAQELGSSRFGGAFPIWVRASFWGFWRRG